MTFSNPLFYLFFVPVALLGFEVMGIFGRRSAIGFLTVMSVLFYARWSRTYTLLLLGSILMNYLFSVAIDRTGKRPALQNAWQAAGITATSSVVEPPRTAMRTGCKPSLRKVDGVGSRLAGCLQASRDQDS